MSKYNSVYKFQDLLNSSKHFTCNYNTVFTYNFSNDVYLYFMVTRNYGNAPSRNIFKRRVRFLFGQLTKKYPDSPIGLMVKPLHERVSYISLKEGFSLLEKKIKLEGGSF